jgi:5-hydroxyisourate hydrolase
MGAITTHILDTSRGRPAAGVAVVLELRTEGNRWDEVGHGETDKDGRLHTLVADGEVIVPGTYRLMFHTRRYFDAQGIRAFHPLVIVVFDVEAGEAHYHVPLLLSPFAYTTYRGS